MYSYRASLGRMRLHDVLICFQALSKNMHLVDEDERLSQILTDFDKRHTGSSYAVKNGSSKDIVTVETLEQVRLFLFLGNNYCRDNIEVDEPNFDFFRPPLLPSRYV